MSPPRHEGWLTFDNLSIRTIFYFDRPTVVCLGHDSKRLGVSYNPHGIPEGPSSSLTELAQRSDGLVMHRVSSSGKYFELMRKLRPTGQLMQKRIWPKVAQGNKSLITAESRMLAATRYYLVRTARFADSTWKTWHRILQGIIYIAQRKYHMQNCRFTAQTNTCPDQ